MIGILVSCFIAVLALLIVSIVRTKNLQLVSGATLLFLILFCVGMGIGIGSYPIAHSISKESAVGGYHQFLNGSIISADKVEYRCTEDGPCTHEYDCDPYTVTHSTTTTDSKGNSTTTYYTTTEYHDCPYATYEYSFVTADTFGNDYNLGSHWFADNPEGWHGHRVPDSVRRGTPPQWQHAKDALAAGNSDPVTVTSEYKNYILSSEDTILKASSDDIQTLRAQNLLPEHTAQLEKPVRDNWVADKISFVGFTPTDAGAWQDALMHFNAGLGMEKQGDMHIVVIKASAVPTSPENYLNALKAYWQSGLGKYALAKNGIGLVLAVDDSGSKIVWSRATTGMPTGNGAMLQALNFELTDTPFTPDAVLGNTAASKIDMVKNDKGKLKPQVTYTIGNGVVPRIILQELPFQRACMECKDAGEAAAQGYVDLSSQIPLSTKGMVWTMLIDVALIAIIWLGLYSFLVVDMWYVKDDESDGWQPYRSYDRSTSYTPTTRSQMRTKKGKRHV